MSSQSATRPKPPLTLCHLSDVHLGYRRYNKLTKAGLNQREADVNLAFQEAINRIIAIKPDAVVIAGDLFHSVRPSNAVVTFCFRQLRKLVRELGAPVVIVGGNHEAPKRVDTGSVLQLFSEIDGVYVADAGREVFTFSEKGLAITCLPHAAFAELSSLQLRADDRFAYNVLVAHAQVNEGWVSDFGGAEVDLASLKPHEWDYIALGHVHIHRLVGRQAAYSGAIEHTSTNIWGEARELKGFLEVQLASGKRTFHPLTSPREVVVLDPVDGAGMEPNELMAAITERIDSVAGGLDGKIARLSLANISRESYKNLDHKALRALRTKALHLTLDITFVSATGDVSSMGKPGKGLLRDQLVDFSKTWDAPGISQIELAEMLERYLAKVEATHEAS
ncbi:MAG: exonuclease SbcCD subunit D [Pseudomonadota bacterium]|jgi:exonuclease SbcD